jgi:hypothetical protein
MADGWNPISMLPRDGRAVWFTRSLNHVGNVVDLSAPAADEPVFAGTLDEHGVFTLGDVVSGEAPEEDAGWAPTHWRYDPDDPAPGPPGTEPDPAQAQQAQVATQSGEADPEPAPKSKKGK